VAKARSYRGVIKPLVSELDARDAQGLKFFSEWQAFIWRRPRPAIKEIHRKGRAIARRLGLRYEPMGFATNVRIASPVIEIPIQWPTGKKLKYITKIDKLWKAGKPVPWNEYDLEIGITKTVKRPLPFESLRPKREPGAPKHPLRMEILEDVRQRPHRTDSERAGDLTTRLKRLVSRSTIRRLRLQHEASPR
jgi:hypothetical protein